ncbi:MAG: molybdopterin-dependent oxidoreductase [Pseudomonadota bacterium]
MNKRHFLGAAALGATSLASSATPSQRGGAVGPALLTVTGAIAKTNRGAFDPTQDILMGKHKLQFQRAWTFDFANLAAMPALTIRPSLEYDGKAHSLKGPLLSEVLARAGAVGADGTKIVLRAIDGYAAIVTMGQLRKEKMIIATHLDGAPMALGALGPLWAVLDADRIPERAAMPLASRFGGCPWALYHIDVIA